MTQNRWNLLSSRCGGCFFLYVYLVEKMTFTFITYIEREMDEEKRISTAYNTGVKGTTRFFEMFIEPIQF